MSKAGGWVPLDKGLIKALPKDRPYSKVEAMFSHTIDIDCGRSWTIKGYAELWSWSRNKVRKFVEEVRTQAGHPVDTLGTHKGHLIHYIDKGLWDTKDTERTHEGHQKDTPRTPTNNPLILNPKKKEKNFLSDSDEIRLSELLFSKIKNRNPKHKEPNYQAWGKHVDLMLRADKRTPGEIERVICWCQEDCFWQNNILSTAKLREKFDALVLKMVGVGVQIGQIVKKEEDKKCAGCGILREFGACKGKTAESRACARYEVVG